jgi:DNA polymerase-1
MTETTNQLLLIDLSAIAHQIWHVSGAEPDPNFVSTQIIARVRALASAHPAAAVCCDSGKSFRADLDPTYKANRDTENRAPLKHQMTLACETLKRDGFPIWAVKGYEADDVIATATLEALNIDGTSVLIASADKDLLQLVSDRVSMKKINGGGEIITAAGVQEKFKVDPSQMGDYLALVGDTSDNIVGAKGIGTAPSKPFTRRWRLASCLA